MTDVVENNSHRYSFYSKSSNSIIDPNSFTFQSSKRQSYIQRLYFEYMYTQKVNGTCFFYTLTYNDKSIPQYKPVCDVFCDSKEKMKLWHIVQDFHFPCFSYDDIRLVTNGVLSKILERKYGSRLRYFCACETGEGKGSRGAGYNPHYHFIFFVQPIHVEGNPVFDKYKVITPLEFRALIRKIWHGDNDYVDYQSARFGIAKEGDNCGLVRGSAPFKYVSKYVLKDNNDLKNEFDVLEYWRYYYKYKGLDLEVLYTFYKYMKEFSDDNLHDTFYEFGLDKYNKWRKMTTCEDKSYLYFVTRFGDLSVKVNLTKLNDFFIGVYLHMAPKLRLKEYINNYSGKVRCSKSLGEYGLEFIKFKDSNPTLMVPIQSGWDYQSICLYYYRKLYYDKYKCDVTGNVLYRLNDLGQLLKVNSLKSRIDSIVSKVNESLDIVFKSSLPDDWFYTVSKYRIDKYISHLIDNVNRNELIRYYASYKLVYQFRSYNLTDFISLDPLFSYDYVKCDYSRFIKLDSYFYDYDYALIRQKLRSKVGWISFDSHPCISPYIDLFRVIDDLLFDIGHVRSESCKSKFAKNAGVAKRVKAHLNNTN